jgi:type III secretory pathway component EscV
MKWTQMMANFTRKTCLIGLGLCIVIAVPTSLYSQDANKENAAKPQRSDQQTKNRELTSGSEQLALQLTREHLPQLTPLLQQLKIDQPRQYDRAVVDLARTAKKLSIAQKRDKQLYQVELELLKADTEANLIAAKLKVRDKRQDRDKLRDAVIRLHAAKQKKMQYEVELLQKRLARDQALLATAEQNLSAFNEDSSNTVDAVYLTLLRKAERTPSANKPQTTTDLKTKRRKANTTSPEQ